ncbi:MAG: FAD-binding oxidoreductase [bacterium]|nr:MAG: FAD-binding oxidoreductase [bacterium]
MASSNDEKTFIFVPGDPDEIEGLYRKCNRLALEGYTIRIGILESPFRPGHRLGIVPGPTEESESAGFISLDGRSVPVLEGTEDIVGEIEKAERSARVNVLITVRRLNRIHEISRSDLVAVVDSGVGVVDLLGGIERAGLLFPYEPLLVCGDETIGELVMDGRIPVTESRFGRLRECLLSIDLITAAGESIHTGSRSVKDVGGYEIAGFVTGSGGVCGTITRLTLRLLPGPARRAYFAAAGPVDPLRRLAKDLHRVQRPAFLLLFEGRAAGMLGERIDSRRLALESLPPMEGAGYALLIVELQASSDGAGGRLETIMSKLAGDGISIAGLDPGIMGELHHLPAIALEALDTGSGIVHISFDADGFPPVPEGSLVIRSLYPERIHYWIPCMTPERTAGEITSLLLADSGTLRDAIPGFDDIYGSIRDRGLRERVEHVVYYNGEPVRRRVHQNDLARVSEEAGEAKDRAASLDALTSRVLVVFDPNRLMLP